MADLPSGTVTFLFTDVEGSTRLWQDHPVAMQPVMARHDEIVRDAIESHEGHVVKTTGDGFHAAFATAHEALDAAIAAQLGIGAESWGAVGALRVRMGLHTGQAEIRDGDYYGTALNRAARLMSAAHGGQIVCSQTTAEIARDELAPGIELRDLGVHQLRDLERPDRVHQVHHAGLDAEFPPLRSLDVYPGNLPSHLSSFVGRERDLEQLLGDLARNQIVTLTGVGGVGKTRLAVQVCADALPRFPDGAWFVDLAPVRDEDQVVSTVARALGVNERAGEELTVTLRDALREREAIVLIDNGEHLVDEVSALLMELTDRPVAARFLVTSREPLGIDGEQVRRVASLDASNASDLFVQRAASVRSDVDWSSYEREIVAICEQLDGIPLAVELAAARTRSMLPPDILRRLDERFRLLQGSRRSARERHQTLLAAVEWSYDLLTPEERVCFDRLAVFRGGFDLDAAEVVCAGGIVDELDVVDLLERLVDKSMVLPIERGHRSNFRLLETMRQFAETKLAQSGESDAYRSRHVDYYRGFAREWGRRAWSADQRDVQARLLSERANLNAMFDRLFEDARWHDLVTATRWLGGFWSTTSPEDGRRWVLAVEPHLDELSRDDRIAYLAFGSYVLVNCSSTIEGCRMALQAIDEAVAAGLDPPPEPYFALTWHARADGRPEEAIELMRTGVALAERRADHWVGPLIRICGLGAVVEVDPEAGLREAEALSNLIGRIDVPTFASTALFSRGDALARLGDLDGADEYFEASLEAARGTVLHMEIGVVLTRGLLAIDHDPERALELLQEAIDRSERLGVMADRASDCYEAVADVWLARGRIREAAVLIAAVDQLREVIQVRGGLTGAPRQERIHAVVRDLLDPHELQVLSARGRSLTRDEMRRFALDQLDPVDA